MDLVPGATLGAVDGPSPTVRQLRHAVLAVTGHEPPTGSNAEPPPSPGWSNPPRLQGNEPEILAFTRDLHVPFDNNQAERDLRMTKVHQRISGGWRTPNGIETFAQIRSYLETGRKHHQNPLDLLYQLFTTGPWPLPSG